MNKLTISDSQTALFEKMADVRRNMLCPLPSGSTGEEKEQELSDAKKAVLIAALRPKCVSEIRMLLYNDGMMSMLCAARESKWVLIGREESKNLLTEAPSEPYSLMLAHLLADSGSAGIEAGLKLTTDAFLLLLAISDACRRRHASDLLGHEVSDRMLNIDDLYTTIEDAYTAPDTRWLFPFVLMSMGYPKINDLNAALNELCGLGILEQDSLVLTGDGAGFADELAYRITATYMRKQQRFLYQLRSA